MISSFVHQEFKAEEDQPEYGDVFPIRELDVAAYTPVE